MKKILSTIIAGLMISSCIGISAFAEDANPTSGSTEVGAHANTIYYVTIPDSVCFGEIGRNSGNLSKNFDVTVHDALIQEGYAVNIQCNNPGNLIMKNKGGTGNIALPFTLAQTNGLFTFSQADLEDGTPKTINSNVSCDTSTLKASGCYKGFMTFTISCDQI